jgi:acyl-CoA synthetase (AMP-forming)/AMP-acid ligase II
MTNLDPDLQRQLAQLDNDLEEGDITRKGWEKRRTILLSDYLGPSQGLSPLNGDGRPAPSLAHQRNFSAASNTSATSHPPSSYIPHVSVQEPPAMHPGRLQARNMSMANSIERRSISGQSSLHIPPGSEHSSSMTDSRAPTMSRADYAFNPAEHPEQNVGDKIPEESSSMSTMLDSQAYFEDFTGSQMQEQHRESYGGPSRYSTGEALSPSQGPPIQNFQDIEQQQEQAHHFAPLEPRDVPFAIVDPHDKETVMSKFDNIGAVLRYRGKKNAKQPAYWVLDNKGKEIASITWEKLASKAEKVAQVIRDKSSLYRGDRVALIYRDSEVIEFAVALMGCFIAGVVAVPINSVDDYNKLNLLLQTTQAHLALTTENNLKTFQRDITQNKLRWPQGVEWWKTNEFGSYHAKKKDDSPTLQVPDLAYIEFSRAPTGDLRGVVLSHRTIMHQMACVSAVVASIPKTKAKDTYSTSLRDRNGDYIVQSSRNSEIILSYLDAREGIGLILGVLLGVYGGHTTVWMEAKTVDTAGLYAHLITRYRASILVADYSRLKFAAYNYQQDPMATRNFKKGMDPNFSTVKICLIDTLTVDTEFHEILADRWFRPMRNERAREVVAPMLCLPEHGGMIVSVRDWLGGEERMGCPLEPEVLEEVATEPEKQDGALSFNSSTGPRKAARKEGRTDLSEVLLDKEALKSNEVIVLATGEDAKRRAHEPGTIRAGAFGYPLSDATLAVVDPETNLLCAPYMVGEIWVDSPSLSGGFWSLPKHTETIFHARPYHFADGSPTPVLIDMEFLRTGLLGCIIEGKVYILGLYEDRIRQKVEWNELAIQHTEHRYFFVQHLISSIMRNIPKIHDWYVRTAHGYKHANVMTALLSTCM